MLSSHTVGFQRPDNSNLANLTPGLCSSSWSCLDLPLLVRVKRVQINVNMVGTYIKLNINKYVFIFMIFTLIIMNA